MEYELLFSNDEGLLTDGELAMVDGGAGVVDALKFIGKKLAGPVGIILDLLDASPAY